MNKHMIFSIKHLQTHAFLSLTLLFSFASAQYEAQVSKINSLEEIRKHIKNAAERKDLFNLYKSFWKCYNNDKTNKFSVIGILDSSIKLKGLVYTGHHGMRHEAIKSFESDEGRLNELADKLVQLEPNKSYAYVINYYIVASFSDNYELPFSGNDNYYYTYEEVIDRKTKKLIERRRVKVYRVSMHPSIKNRLAKIVNKLRLIGMNDSEAVLILTFWEKSTGEKLKLLKRCEELGGKQKHPLAYYHKLYDVLKEEVNDEVAASAVLNEFGVYLKENSSSVFIKSFLSSYRHYSRLLSIR